MQQGKIHDAWPPIKRDQACQEQENMSLIWRKGIHQNQSKPDANLELMDKGMKTVVLTHSMCSIKLKEIRNMLRREQKILKRKKDTKEAFRDDNCNV